MFCLQSRVDPYNLSTSERTSMRRLTVFAALSCGFTLMAADPIVGTWKVNVEKSKMRNPVQSEIMKIEETAPNTYRCVFDIVTPTGEKLHREIIRIADGKEHPVEGVNTNAAGASEITSPGLRRVVQNRDGSILENFKSSSLLTIRCIP